MFILALFSASVNRDKTLKIEQKLLNKTRNYIKPTIPNKEIIQSLSNPNYNKFI